MWLKCISSDGGGRLPQQQPRFMALALGGTKVRGGTQGREAAAVSQAQSDWGLNLTGCCQCRDPEKQSSVVERRRREGECLQTVLRMCYRGQELVKLHQRMH